MSDTSRATDANDPSLTVPNNIQQYTGTCSPDGTFESSDLWNDRYDDSATASDITALDHFDSQVYNNPASLLAPLPDLATDYAAVDYSPPNFLDCAEGFSGYGAINGMEFYSPYYYATEFSSDISPTPYSQPATQPETGNASTGNDDPAYDGPPAPTQLESNNCHPDETDVPKARVIRKKGRRPRPPAANEESPPPPATPYPSIELGEPDPSTQRADFRTSQAPLKRKLDSTLPLEFDRADKRRRRNTNQDAARIGLGSGEEEQPGGMGSSNPREEEAPVRPRRSLRLSKQRERDEWSYREDDNLSTRSPGPGEPGPSTCAQDADVPSPGSVYADHNYEPPSRPASGKKHKRFCCSRCTDAPGFHRANDLKRHQRYHCQTDVPSDCDKSRLVCPGCHKLYSRPDSLRRHRKNAGACPNNIAQSSMKKVKRFEKHDDFEELKEDSDWGE
ncbi:hypothetical protein EDD18DRAFT_1457354 [Armillaria luteobubalina]|uniref:Uncharacterized protein n=1 Tax=Armillaria luteobubalina TaxID=153913 RepID=A0AA39QJX1_9AGAR|nr:hypothetical protein EDD18DRAFT_1457354 [Armillaria luteobubalina]